MRHEVTREVYWDDQDPNNEGWAYRITYSDGHQESGPLDSVEKEDAILEAGMI